MINNFISDECNEFTLFHNAKKYILQSFGIEPKNIKSVITSIKSLRDIQSNQVAKLAKDMSESIIKENKIKKQHRKKLWLFLQTAIASKCSPGVYVECHDPQNPFPKVGPMVRLDSEVTKPFIKKKLTEDQIRQEFTKRIQEFMKIFFPNVQCDNPSLRVSFKTREENVDLSQPQKNINPNHNEL